jgi:hypothetical protein
MASAAARRPDHGPPRGARLRVVEPAKSSSRSRTGQKKATGAAEKTGPARGKKAPAASRAARPVQKSAAGRAGAAPRAKATKGGPARTHGAPRTRPRPAAFSADGLISRATDAVLPARCEESPLTATCRSAFRLFVVGLLVVGAFGMVRVTLSAQAAQALAASQKMKKELRAERLVSDDLEISRVALAQPFRIESIAASSMSMGKPVSVRYIALPAKLPSATPPPGAGSPMKTSSLAPVDLGVLAAATAQLTSREAQVLLASGSGLGGSR